MPEIREELLDPDAVKVVRRLRRAGHQAYLVGGCVRDSLLSIRPKDYDVATSAHPAQVKETFRNSRLIGRRFRLAHVFFRGGKIIEVSTFRANPLDELQDLPSDKEGPRFVINATNVQSGALWRFSKPYMGDYKVWVQFDDGRSGVRPPKGTRSP